MFSRRPLPLPVLVLATLSIGLLTGFVATSIAAAQETYKTDPVDAAFVMPDPSKYDKSNKEQKAELSNLEKAAKAARSSSQETAENVLKGIADLGTARAEFDRYFNAFLFPSMTLTDEDSLLRLGDRRADLLKNIRDSGNDSPARRHILEDLILPYFSRVAVDTGYHPAVRLNAVLILGNVNRRDGQRNVEPSVPFEAGLRVLVPIAVAADTPNYLKVGAMSGILRHAIIDGQLPQPAMDNALRTQIIDMAAALLESTAPADANPLPADVYWMRRQAVQILGAFRTPGADGKAVAALRKVLDDPNTPLLLAADAVEAYGNMQFASPEQADVANAVKSIGGIVSRFFKADMQALDDYIAGIKDNQMIAKRSAETSSAPPETGGDEGGVTSSGGARGKSQAAEAGQSKAAANVAAAGSSIEVPNYKLNDVRQRSKYIVYVARRALDGVAPKRKNETKPPENLKKFADPATAKVIEQMVAALDRVMDETDLAEPKLLPSAAVQEGQALKAPESKDQRLRNSLKAGIDSIESAIGVNAPVEQAPAIQSAVGGS